MATLIIPYHTDYKLHCVKKSIEVRGIKKEIIIGNITMIIYVCEHSDCKYKSSCVYMFPDTIYHCHDCNTYSYKSPIYKLKPIGRLCAECGAVITDTIPPNWRLIDE